MARTREERIQTVRDLYLEIFGESAPIGTPDWKVAQEVMLYLLKLKKEETFFDRYRLLDVVYACVFDIQSDDKIIQYKIKNFGLRYTLKIWPHALSSNNDREVRYEWYSEKSSVTKKQMEAIVEVLSFIAENWKYR